eukprot:2619001-Lingulodinium_polyedra.AAC.1
MDDQPFVDSCVIFLVGPVSKVKLRAPSLGDMETSALRSTQSNALALFIRGCGEPASMTEERRVE